MFNPLQLIGWLRRFTEIALPRPCSVKTSQSTVCPSGFGSPWSPFPKAAVLPHWARWTTIAAHPAGRVYDWRSSFRHLDSGPEPFASAGATRCWLKREDSSRLFVQSCAAAYNRRSTSLPVSWERGCGIRPPVPGPTICPGWRCGPPRKKLGCGPVIVGCPLHTPRRFGKCARPDGPAAREVGFLAWQGGQPYDEALPWKGPAGWRAAAAQLHPPLMKKYE